MVQDPGNRKDIKAGDRVTALPINPCGVCKNCMSSHSNICMDGLKRPNPGNNSPGAYAEYISVRPDMVRKIPDIVSDKEAALIEPASVALHAVTLADIRIGDSVLITGGGPIGVLCAVWARIHGAGLVVLSEPDVHRIDFSKEQGFFDQVLDATDADINKKIRKITSGGADAAIETSAADAGIQTAISSLKTSGRLVLAGISFRPQSVSTLTVIMKELTIKAAFAYVPSEFDLTIDFLSKRKISIEALVTSEIQMEKVQQTFEQFGLKNQKNMKVLIRPFAYH
jgi:2-desacetyl-2-hydroxyethyl bacteriochlorophyllide A dehydrogenase